MMRTTLKLFVLAAVTVLSACGQQGPLYFPADAPAQNSAPATSDTTQDTQPQAASQP
ncbi:LPS translocon maturation chaperone LptM [Enterovibrio norvegicus]|uniref:Lipoprotein-attachment site-containing protein n=1 Tax=Enterovibrio norvegicus DSM 15893 TaxID=1121869 RepID=A0A1I5RVW2_9GAMM|nr:lipoprotein [Enterovibrio norvegicus]SFP62567.1 lipoprotein-attachment site-containing protein [Enterovibrio norvegicus DSM 15893]